jgi:serine/threonine-protein kinase
LSVRTDAASGARDRPAHSPRIIGAMPDETQPASAPVRHGPRAGTDSRAGARASRLLPAGVPFNAVAVAAVLGLIALGAWMYFGVKHSLQEIRSAGLRIALEAQANTLQLWVENRKTHVEHWSQDLRVRRLVAELAALSRNGDAAPEKLWNAPARRALAALLEPVLRGDGAAGFTVVDATGRVIAAQHRGDHWQSGIPAGLPGHLHEVFQGRTQFIRPHPDTGRVEDAAGSIPASAVVRLEAPVADERERIVAALGFSYRADGEFAKILSARLGATGEAYVFDERGVMLSESRFLPELRKAGLAPEGAGAILRVQVRDPGGDIRTGHVPALERAALPLTRLAALAIASRDKTEARERQGIVLEPYRNYLGVPVIGAWQWLAGMDMGLAMELGAGEAYAPLSYLNLAFAVVLATLSAAALAVLWSAYSVGRLRRQAGEPRMIGQYQLEREIGEGGMARVYLARHGLLKRPTALKLLKPHLASDEIVARFEREVQLASQLVHPNTIEIYDYGRTRDGLFYYVMEYLEGETLDRLVAAHGRMPAGRAIHVLKQVCAALREAHGRGLVHRDIKPQNIMLCERAGEHDVVKILDFGLVKDVHGRQSRDITQFQRLVGTPLYMAPERMRNPGDADARSDIYSIGAVGFFLLTGRDVFESGGEHDLTYHVLHTPAPRPSESTPGIPRRLDDLIARCLAKDRTERPHDVLVVLALLEALSVEHPWSAREAGDAQRRAGRATR